MSDPKTKPVTELKALDDQVPVFPVPLDLQRLDGVQVRVTINCKVFGKRAWARMRREHVDAVMAEEVEIDRQERLVREAAQQAAAAEGAPAPRPAMPRLDEILERGVRRDADFFASVAVGWSLPGPCDAEALAELDDRFGNALAKLLDAYEAAVYQGQLGNSAPSRAR